MPPERCYTIHTDAWDDDILRALDIPASLLPEVRDSSGDFGVTACFDGAALPIGGVIGDQQGTLFGQACSPPAWSRTPTEPGPSC